MSHWKFEKFKTAHRAPRVGFTFSSRSRREGSISIGSSSLSETFAFFLDGGPVELVRLALEEPELVPASKVKLGEPVPCDDIPEGCE